MSVLAQYLCACLLFCWSPSHHTSRIFYREDLVNKKATTELKHKLAEEKIKQAKREKEEQLRKSL